MFKKFYRQILLTETPNAKLGPLGTFVSHFAAAMQGSFRYDPKWLVTKEQLDTTEEAEFIHNFFKSISIAMTNDAISLLDVPALLGVSQPFTSPVDVISLHIFNILKNNF